MKKVLFMVLSIFILGCSTCFAAEQVQMNDNLGAASVVTRYNHLAASVSDMDDCIAGELHPMGQNANYDGFGTQCKNNSLLLFQCNKAGYVVGCMIASPDRNTVIKETLVMMSVITNYEKASDACKRAISASFTDGQTHVWYSNNMNRYYGIDVDCVNGLYKATLVAAVQ